MATGTSAVSNAFIWRRIHSLMGLWLVIYLIEHLIVNSQATLWLGDDGIGFIRMVNLIQSLPYLQVVETVFIGVPLAVHGIWGIRRALSAKTNSWKTEGKKPELTRYGRNHAFTWQRIASWILLFGVAGHVVQMRFLEKPKEVMVGGKKQYENRVTFDEGLKTLAPRLGVTLEGGDCAVGEKVSVICPSPGTAMLLMVRNAFKDPVLAVLYTVFVLAAAYHAFNGVWTFLITWGMILSYRSQRAMIPISVGGILLLSFLGIAAIWGSYWLNLRS